MMTRAKRQQSSMTEESFMWSGRATQQADIACLQAANEPREASRGVNVSPGDIMISWRLVRMRMNRISS
jgi:hypothetical protein